MEGLAKSTHVRTKFRPHEQYRSAHQPEEKGQTGIEGPAQERIGIGGKMNGGNGIRKKRGPHNDVFTEEEGREGTGKDRSSTARQVRERIECSETRGSSPRRREEEREY